MVFQDMVLRGKTQKCVDTDQEDNLNELRLEISQVWFGDKNLIIRCNNLQSPEMSGPVPPSGQCWSSVKLLSHIAYTYKLALSCWVATSPKQIICCNTEARSLFHFKASQVNWCPRPPQYVHKQTVMHIVLEVHTHMHTPRCTLRLQSSQGSCLARSMMVSAPSDLHSKSASPLLQQPGAKNAPETWCEMR